MSDKPEMPQLDQLDPPGVEAATETPSRRRKGRGAAPTDAPTVDAAPAQDDAPPKRRGRPPGSATGARSQATANRVSGKLRGIMSTAGAVLSALGHDVPGRVLIGNAPPADLAKVTDPAQACADAWGKLAAQDKRVARVIDGLSAGGVYGEVILTTGMLVIPILASYGLLPPKIAQALGFGVNPEPAPIVHAPFGSVPVA